MDHLWYKNEDGETIHWEIEDSDDVYRVSNVTNNCHVGKYSKEVDIQVRLEEVVYYYLRGEIVKTIYGEVTKEDYPSLIEWSRG